MGTRAPEIPATLLSIWAVPGVFTSTVQVVDGPLVRGDIGTVLFVGYDGDPEADFESVTTEREPATFGEAAFDERVTVICALLLRSGDGNTTAARTEIYGIFDELTEAVDQDPTLGLSGVTAHIPSSRLQLLPSERVGLNALLTFPVVAEVL